MKRLCHHINRKNLHRILLLLGIFYCMQSCTEKIEWDLKYQEENLIVVEAKITNEVKRHEVKLRWPVFELNGDPEPVVGAEVVIHDGRMLHPLREDPLSPGTYLTTPDFAGEVNKVVLLPVEALQDQQGTWGTVLVLENGEISQLEVELGLRDMIYVEVIKGLSAGDVVVIEYQSK